MAKRFTDTDKWKDPWFKKLPKEYKLLWIFMLDTCDHAGIWTIQFDLFEFSSGYKIDEKDALLIFSERLLKLNDETFFISKFITFQYGILYENNSAHIGVMKQLVKYNIDSLVEIQQKPDPSLRTRLSSKSRMKIFTSNNFTCEYCSGKFHPDALTIDHIIPLSSGGTNCDTNLACACATCNSYKSTFPVIDFAVKHKERFFPSQRIITFLEAPVKELQGAQDKDKDKDKVMDKDMDKDKERSSFNINEFFKGIEGYV